MDPLEQIKNYYRISAAIGTAGQPEAAQFRLIKRAGFDVVINLSLPDSPDAIQDEEQLVQLLGLDYVPIPVDFETPALSDLKRFFATMDRYKHNTVFVHCAYNWRVSAFMFLYRTVRCDQPMADASRDLHAVWQPDPVWQAFIESMLTHYRIDH